MRLKGVPIRLPTIIDVNATDDDGSCDFDLDDDGVLDVDEVLGMYQFDCQQLSTSMQPMMTEVVISTLTMMAFLMLMKYLDVPIRLPTTYDVNATDDDVSCDFERETFLMRTMMDSVMI